MKFASLTTHWLTFSTHTDRIILKYWQTRRIERLSARESAENLQVDQILGASILYPYFVCAWFVVGCDRVRFVCVCVCVYSWQSARSSTSPSHHPQSISFRCHHFLVSRRASSQRNSSTIKVFHIFIIFFSFLFFIIQLLLSLLIRRHFFCFSWCFFPIRS